MAGNEYDLWGRDEGQTLTLAAFSFISWTFCFGGKLPKLGKIFCGSLTPVTPPVDTVIALRDPPVGSAASATTNEVADDPPKKNVGEIGKARGSKQAYSAETRARGGDKWHTDEGGRGSDVWDVMKGRLSMETKLSVHELFDGA
jgi:hypothetical protein